MMHYSYRTCACGTVKGIGAAEYDLFKGIPYAHAQRWEPPVPVTQWQEELDATVQGVWCPQRNTFDPPNTPTARFYRNENVEKQTILYSEDCLNLNVWTPKDAENAPVLVYIHGGSFETGGGSAPSFRGLEYCRRGILLVTINYRLNAFSSAVGDGHSGNYGLQDQICALQWVQRNIAGFGGDPDKVCIMGESAGAMSVQALIFSPMAKGLFRSAIMLSGGGILPHSFRIKPPANREELWNEIKKEFGANTLEDLKKVSPGELFMTWKHISMSNPKFSTPAAPVIDGQFLPDWPHTLVEEGRVNAVPTIVSVLSEDMWPHTLYQAICDWGLAMEKNGLPPVYAAYFDRAIPGSDYGAYHGCDVRYAFGSLDTSWHPFAETDYRISRNMVDYFSAFVKTGVPQVEDLVQWPAFGKEQTRFMHFGDDPCAMVDVPAERLQATEAKGKPFPAM